MTPDFSSLALNERLQSVLNEIGFTSLTEIQARAIPPLLEGRDVLGQSATGSGKTAAYALPLLHRLDPNLKAAQALIVCPTRELALQVTRELRRLGRKEAGLEVALLSGGLPFRAQAEALARGAQVLVGTPGRLLDHLERHTVDFSNLKMLVLDEADRMLDMGFAEDVIRLIESTPSDRQTMLFSATYPALIARMSHQFQRSPLHIKVEPSPNTEAQSTITHVIYPVEDIGEKRLALTTILRRVPTHRALVFCNQKLTVNELVTAFADHDAAPLHGDLEQRDRDRVLARFRNGSVRLLIATDVAARGLDISDLDLVVAYDTPHEPAVYTHRAGRTGRAGKAGLAISIATMIERQRLREFSVEAEMFEKYMRETPAPVARVAEKSAMRTIYISGGRKDKLRAGDIVGALTGETGGLKAEDIGQIEIHDKFTYVGVKLDSFEHATRCLAQGRIKGRRFQIKSV